VISRPTTEQVILDCRRELLEVVRPQVSDPAVQVTIDMLENVLRNVATRAAHEIAWMTEEISTMAAYARGLLADVHDDPDDAALAAAVDALSLVPRESLHLDAVVAAYSVAGEAFSCALEAAIAAGRTDWQERGVALLLRRTEREQEVKGDWSMTGRG
jgi:hypothetical protein